MSDPPEISLRLARRTLLGGAGLVLTSFFVGVPVGTRRAQAFTPLEAAIDQANSLVGSTAAAVNSAIVVGSPWKDNAPAAWCAWFASYIARGAGVGRYISAPGLYGAFPAHSSPQPGDFIYYNNSSTAGHVGFVVGINSDGSARTVEGNTTGAPTIVKAYAKPWSTPTGYSRPNWASGGDEMPFFNNKESTAPMTLPAGVESTVFFAGGDYDLGGSPAGGPGIYDITLHMYFTGLVEGTQVETRLSIEDVATLAQSGWYKWTDEGALGGTIEAEHTTKLVMPAGKRLRLYALTSATGVGISHWGRIVLNYQS